MSSPLNQCLAPFLAGAVLLLASCGSPASEPVAPSKPAASKQAAASKAAASKPAAVPKKPADGCLPVGAAMGKAVLSGAEAGTNVKFVRAAAVKSPDFEKVYFIAVEFSAPGVDKQTGVFASNALTDGGGMLMAVDGIAKQFTVWPDADKTQAAISSADPAVDAAKACLS